MTKAHDRFPMKIQVETRERKIRGKILGETLVDSPGKTLVETVIQIPRTYLGEVSEIPRGEIPGRTLKVNVKHNSKRISEETLKQIP